MTNVLLVEAGPRVLPGYPEALSDYAKGALEKLGVEVALGAAVTEVGEDRVTFGGRSVGLHLREENLKVLGRG